MSTLRVVPMPTWTRTSLVEHRFLVVRDVASQPEKVLCAIGLGKRFSRQWYSISMWNESKSQLVIWEGLNSSRAGQATPPAHWGEGCEKCSIPQLQGTCTNATSKAKTRQLHMRENSWVHPGPGTWASSLQTLIIREALGSCVSYATEFTRTPELCFIGKDGHTL